MIWIAGNKKKGISVYKLTSARHFRSGVKPHPFWRVGIWLNGKLDTSNDFDTRAEAMEYARSRKRMRWYD